MNGYNEIIKLAEEIIRMQLKVLDGEEECMHRHVSK